MPGTFDEHADPVSFPAALRPLGGGFSGETFLSEVDGEEAVARIYGPRSAWRGPLAPEVDAAVLELVRGLLPVPRVLEVRRGDPAADLPGLLLTSRLPGERLDLVLPRLDAAGRRTVGAHLGTVLGRLGHMVQVRAGAFRDLSLVPVELPAEQRDLEAWVDAHADALVRALGDAELLAALREVAGEAQDLLEEERRLCLVHADLNPKNLLVDPGTLEVTGVLDWEFAHAGSPYADLGNLLRFERDPELTGSVLGAYRAFMPRLPDDVLARARAADLFALVELAARADPDAPEGPNEVVRGAVRLLAAIAHARDPGAAAP